MKSAKSLAGYPFTPQRLHVPGGSLAYLDEGQGPAVVMVHGNPSWSYLYRDLVAMLRPRFRCIVPDHLGCGFSDKPKGYPYRLANHIANLERLLTHLDPGPCLLVLHDWGGPIGLGWAGKHPQQVAGTVVCNSAAFPADFLPWRIRVCGWPLLGELLVLALNGFARAAVHMAVVRPMPTAVRKGFLFPYDCWSSRRAILGFVRDIPRHSGHPSWTTLLEVEQGLGRLQEHPMLLCWGLADFCFHGGFFQEWQHRFPRAAAYGFRQAGHYLFEDAGSAIFPLINRFVARCHGC